jgi:hypothetical protein
VPLVASEVRQSERIKSNNEGFKPKSCFSKNCFCCSTEAPTLSTKVIRSLGTDFCKISAQLPSDDSLKRKSVLKKSVGPRVNVTFRPLKRTVSSNHNHYGVSLLKY